MEFIEALALTVSQSALLTEWAPIGQPGLPEWTGPPGTAASLHFTGLGSKRFPLARQRSRTHDVPDR